MIIVAVVFRWERGGGGVLLLSRIFLFCFLIMVCRLSVQLKLLQLQLQNILLRIISFEIFFFFSRNDVYDLSGRKEQKLSFVL